ncbi:MAG TPA: hypothetical protein VHK69_04585 [Chitinophagaceae bacterium]|nr:hypothetical protein [Chitinophagaceae bacterium]
MKKQFMPVSNPLKRKPVYLTFLLLFSGSLAAQAQTAAPTPEVTVQAKRTADSQTQCRVQLTNKEGEKFSIAIADANGNRIFYQVYQDRTFDRTFRLEEGLEEEKLVLTIRSLKDHTVQHFTINTETRVQKDVVVTRL